MPAATLSGRARAVLGRFPAHLALDDPTKVFADVVDTFARELDRRSTEVGRIRKAHRLHDAETEWDLIAHGALHGMRPDEFEIVRRRLAAYGSLAAALATEPGGPAAAEAREALTTTANVTDDVFPVWEGEPDTAAADQRLAAALSKVVRYDSELDLLQRHIGSLIAVHQHGNATPSALLTAAASHLALDVDEIAHSDDRYWHIARCTDQLLLDQPRPPSVDATAGPASAPVLPLPDLVALEDNPFRTAEVDPVERSHGDRFLVTRSGWEPVPVTVRVVGLGVRTVGPMVVNVDSGVGVAYTREVPDGSELRFESVGAATLDGATVTRDCYGFVGGVFAERDAHHVRDFVFADADDPDVGADRAGTWSLAIPYAQAFERAAVFPHAAGTLTAPELRVGETRWAFFVRVGHFGTRNEVATPFVPLAAVPPPFAGIWDRSVFHPFESTGHLPSGEVGFEWQEREAFAARLWLPRRFAELDEGQTVTIAERVRLLLDRFRAAGVHLYVRYADERWVLGTGLLRDLDAADGLGIVVAGTALWTGDTEQPSEEP
jgi:hypothetical protein